MLRPIGDARPRDSRMHLRREVPAGRAYRFAGSIPAIGREAMGGIRGFAGAAARDCHRSVHSGLQ